MTKKMLKAAIVVVSLMVAAATALFTAFSSEPVASGADSGATTISTDEAGNTIVDTRTVGADFRGYAGPTPVLITISKDGKILRVQPQENQETRNFFQEVEASGYYNKWVGKTVDEALQLKVDAVSGATMSSTSLTQNVIAGLKAYKNGGAAGFDYAQLLPWISVAVFLVVIFVLLRMHKRESKSLGRTLVVLFGLSLLAILHQAFSKSYRISNGELTTVDQKSMMLNFIAKRNNVKKFTSQKVSREQIDSLIGYGQMVTAGKDEDARSFIVLNKPEMFDSIMPAEHRHRRMGDASTLILICGDKAILDHHDRPTTNFYLYGAQAAQNMAYAAQSMGLATSVMNFTDERLVTKMKRLLSLPESVVPFCFVAVGYPKIDLPASKLKTRSEAVHFNKW